MINFYCSLERNVSGISMKKIELLSPVGNKEMLYQAIHNGADAVYLAGKSYGARKFSDNFDNDELENAVRYSHLYGVLVYVTVNTIIYESEVNDFLDYVEFLYKIGVDAVIMQDLGMISLVRKKFPNLEIHASTQCHNHNEEGIKLLKELGCSRVVMAREMSLDEINNINVPIEKEVFVYGALCVCYSGCCLFSSLNGGRSGNRGECVGSCRLPYKLIKNDKEVILEDRYLLSTRELNTLPNLKKILDSNIDSLKIEGRMKSPYYVGYVTKVYRMLIDKYYNNEEMILTDDELNNLKLLFNRGFTSGYLFNDRDVMNIKSPNHIGIEIGKVIDLKKKKIYIKLNDDLSQEDGIRFRDNEKGMIVNKLYNEKGLLVNKVLKNNICVLDNKIGLNKKDVVLKTISNELVRDLENYSEKKIPVSFEAVFKIGDKFVVSISDGVNKIVEEGMIVDCAIKREVVEDDIRKCLSKLGNTPFILDNLVVDKDKNIFVNLRDINEIRRRLVDKLVYLRSNKIRDVVIKDVMDDNNILDSNKKVCLNVLVRNEEQLRCCLDNKVDNIYITDYDLYLKYGNLDNVYYRCGRVNNKYMDIKNSKLLIGELGSVNKYKMDNVIVSDYYLNVVNSYSVKYLNDLGVKRVTLSVELNKDKVRDIMKNNYDVEMIVYGRLELMVMKYCPLKKCLNYCNLCDCSSDKFYLEDKFGNRYPVIRERCFSHVMHFKNIDYISDIWEYKEMGINNFRLELFDEVYEEVDECIKRARKYYIN